MLLQRDSRRRSRRLFEPSFLKKYQYVFLSFLEPLLGGSGGRVYTAATKEEVEMVPKQASLPTSSAQVVLYNLKFQKNRKLHYGKEIVRTHYEGMYREG
jgi:hypothetical protein